MCGFSGVINLTEQSVDAFPIEKMTDCIAHRGPDDSGYFKDKNVSFGFRRLSIIDVAHGHQPMKSKDKRYVIVFNGEIYNFKKIKKELIGLGYTFETNCDTEVIIYAFDLWGKNCVNRFHGMFAFVIYDTKLNNIFIARDRLGIKPFYYTFLNNNFIFGSEIKSILQCQEFKRDADLKAISSYLTFRYTFSDKTFFKSIKKLLPGHHITINKNTFLIEKYWEIPFLNEKNDLGEKFYIDKVRNLLEESIKKRLISDVPLGALLSGGLDSSIVVAFMSKLSNTKVNSYSIGFDSEGYDESKYAKLVADYCSTNHTSLNLDKDSYINDLKKMIIQKDAPLSIPHEIALYRISKKLKEYTTVVISGEGADELFAGYGRVQKSPFDYKKIRLVNRYFPKFFRKRIFQFLGAGELAEQWLKIKSKRDYFFSVYNWMPFEEKWSLFTESALNEIEHDKELINFWSDDFKFTNSGNEYDQYLYMFQKNHLICLLDRLDGMTMAAGVEARVPFVDHELIEFVSSIPIKYKLKWKSPFNKFLAIFQNSFKFSEKLDISKFILRKIGLEMLPKVIPFRRKKGFPVPLDSWIHDGLIEYAKEILLDERCLNRNIFKEREIRKLINRPQNLDYDFWGKKIWMLINVEIWYREFID